MRIHIPTVMMVPSTSLREYVLREFVMMECAAEKAVLRRRAQELRHRLAVASGDAGRDIKDHFVAAIALSPGCAVAGYIPVRDEADPQPLLQHLRIQGHAIALPRVVGKRRPLQFHLWRQDDRPVAGAFKLFEPAADWPTSLPAVVLVPLLAFDRQGYRLGYGGGYYDRTLRDIRARAEVLAVGIAFSGQEMDLPHHSADEKLDWIVTEIGVRKFER